MIWDRGRVWSGFGEFEKFYRRGVTCCFFFFGSFRVSRGIGSVERWGCFVDFDFFLSWWFLGWREDVFEFCSLREERGELGGRVVCLGEVAFLGFFF